jgi:hypothetical protein
MIDRRRRALVYAAAALVGVWLLAGAGYLVSNRSKMTAEKVVSYLQNTDLQTLSGEDRAKALAELARRLNVLSYEERRTARMAVDWERWFAAMTDQEKSDFIEATMPTGFKQMLTAFEQLPEEKRRRAVNDAMRQLKRSREEAVRETREDSPLRFSTNGPPPLSEELQQKVVTIGLKTFYSESSAQTKAEMAPLLEEMQRAMESGALFRGPRREL